MNEILVSHKKGENNGEKRRKKKGAYFELKLFVFL